jgi:signal transduction histidine kinase
VPEPLRDVIYRVVQESVANALRHAETKRISIAVVSASDGITVGIINRGSSRAAAAGVTGLGLVSMRERVHAAGGSLCIDRASEGWTVSAKFGRSTEQMVA